MNDPNLTKKQLIASAFERAIARCGYLSYLSYIFIGLLLLALPVSLALAQSQGTITIVESAGKVGSSITLALTSEGLPVIGYNDSTDYFNNYSKVAFCHNPTCTSKKVAAVYDSRLISSIRLKAGNLPVMLYDAYPNPRLIVCQDPTCNSFTNTTAFELNYPESYFRGAMTLTPTGIPVMTFVDTSSHRVYLVRCSDPTCSAPPTRRAIESVDTYPFDFEILLTKDNRPLISYQTAQFGFGGGDIIRLVVCHDPNCVNSTLTVVDKEEFLSTSVSLQLNSAGVPVISYIDTDNYALKVALCDTLVCDYPEIKTLDMDIEEVGRDQSMVLTSDDRPIISYETDSPDYNLKLAVCGDPQCNEVTVTVLDSKDEVGEYNTLALTADDLPVVAYRNTLQEDLLLYTFRLNNASLNFNHFRGGPDSVFTLNGSGFPANAAVTITINGASINTNLTSDAAGRFTFLFDGTGANLGYYNVKVKVVTALGFSTDRQANFLIETTAPKRVAGGPAPTVNVPAGIGRPPRFVQLPLLIK